MHMKAPHHKRLSGSTAHCFCRSVVQLKMAEVEWMVAVLHKLGQTLSCQGSFPAASCLLEAALQSSLLVLHAADPEVIALCIWQALQVFSSTLEASYIGQAADASLNFQNLTSRNCCQHPTAQEVSASLIYDLLTRS